MRLLALLLFSVCARAAVVEGVVLDEETGNPLARTQVSLVPLPGTPADATPVRTGARGSFVILSVRPGWYVVRATRRGYAPAESGQSKPGRPGHAFEVADDRASGFFEMRMSHLPAITGTVLDENDIGIPKWPVHVYTSGKPIRHVAQTFTDDRGNFRIGELAPGSFLLRSGPGNFEDKTTVLATYSKAAVELADAIGVTAHVGETVMNVVIRPVKGKFVTLAGNLIPQPQGIATLTLVTDTGRREIMSAFDIARPFTVTDVQPGPVELIVKGVDFNGTECGSYTRLIADKDLPGLRVACSAIAPLVISVSGASLSGPLTIRRVDLDGAGEPHPLTTAELLIPGHWEISVPPGDYYVQSIRNSGALAAHAGEWWGFDTGTYTRLAIQLSSRPASISGVVRTKDNPMAGAPIFLAQMDSGQTWTGRSDAQGHYVMGGLAPGNYIIVSSFELDPADGLTARKANVATQEGNVTTVELVLQ